MGPRHDLSFCACTTACLASELLVSMGPSPHLCFLHAKQRHLDQTYKSLRIPVLTCRFVHAIQRNYHQNYCIYGSHPFCAVFAFKTAPFGAELQVSMGPRPHLWFLHAKQRLLDANNKSLWAPDITCRFEHAIQRD